MGEERFGAVVWVIIVLVGCVTFVALVLLAVYDSSSAAWCWLAHRRFRGLYRRNGPEAPFEWVDHRYCSKCKTLR